MQAPGSRRLSLRWLLILVVVMVAAVAAWWYWSHRGEPAQAGATATSGPGSHSGRRSGAPKRPGFGGSEEATPVRVASVTQADFPVFLKALGTVTSTNTVSVRSRVAGELVKVSYQEGQKVKAGDLLAQIDPRSYQIALQQAQGTLLQNQALLKNAQIDLQRYQGLFKEDSIAKQTMDTQAALVAQYLGTIKTNEAAVNDAKLNLDFTQIRSPVTGRVGLRQLDVGNLVAANDTTALAVITQMQPITVVFTLPETQLAPVLERYHSGATLAAEAWDRGDSKLQASGVLASLDNQIDTSTGTLKFKARFENRDEALFPNQFVNIRLLANTLKQAVLVPSAAVQYGTNGSYVYVVGDDKKVSLRQLKLGDSDGASTVVLDGLKAGDKVVLEGTDRLRDGSAVEVVSDPAQIPTEPGEHLHGKGAEADGGQGKRGA
jgi:multidrug efflux system membrane fusion protein